MTRVWLLLCVQCCEQYLFFALPSLPLISPMPSPPSASLLFSSITAFILYLYLYLYFYLLLTPLLLYLLLAPLPPPHSTCFTAGHTKVVRVLLDLAGT